MSTYEHKCKKCGETFYSKIQTSIYCSKFCKAEDSVKLRKFTCQCCGQEIVRTGKQCNGKVPKYCSEACRIVSLYKGGEHRVCQVCGESKYYNPYYNNRVKNPGVYVCKVCRTSGNIPTGKQGERVPRVECQCHTCGKPMRILQSRANNNKHNYCSKRCVKSTCEGKYKGLTRIKGTTKQTLTYVSYRRMLNRCHNPENSNYKFYGAKGVIVCDRWKDSYQNFVDDMGERPTKELTLDRINPYGNYEPDNCRWADQKTQTTNKRKRM